MSHRFAGLRFPKRVLTETLTHASSQLVFTIGQGQAQPLLRKAVEFTSQRRSLPAGASKSCNPVADTVPKNEDLFVPIPVLNLEHVDTEVDRLSGQLSDDACLSTT